jgi:CobQ-like glutamine amidotransferase family enzyme
MNEIKICHLYPDLLNLYGDRGNILCIKKRCEWRGINVKVDNISINDRFDASAYDIVFLGGGQDFEQDIIQDDLQKHKAGEIKNYINENRVMLCICGGYQILGKYYLTHERKEIKTLKILNYWTIAGEDRLIGNIVFELDFLKNNNENYKVLGFENHSGRTYLGKGIKPLGKVIKGYGNNDVDNTEGAMYRNVICSYSHGSLLPKNPMLADYVISNALKNKYSDFVSLSSIDDKLESLANASMLKKLTGRNNRYEKELRSKD